MGNNLAQREHEFVGWIKTQRQIHHDRTQNLFLVPQPDPVASLVPPAVAGEPEPPAPATIHHWANRVPDELIVAVSALGACIGSPIGAAAGGVMVGLLCGLIGAFLGAMVVLAVARVLQVVVRVVAIFGFVTLACVIVHALLHRR